MRIAMERLFMSSTIAISTSATPYGSASGTPRHLGGDDEQMQRERHRLVEDPLRKETRQEEGGAEVNMMGAVSPVVRETSRMTPVRMPLTAFGSTTRWMVCHRVAPMFQHASRNASGTAWSDSRVATITTGRVMMPRVRLAARMPRAEAEEDVTNARRPRTSAWTTRRHPREVDDAEVDDPGEPVVGRVLAQVERGRDPERHREEQGDRDQPYRPQQRREDLRGGHAVGRIREQEVRWR